MPRKQTRGERAIRWIEAYCLVPSGLDKGQHVRLTLAQRDIVRHIYDGIEAVPVTGPLAAYLALMHVCGPEALQKEFRPELSADIFTVWGAVGPDLRAVLKREERPQRRRPQFPLPPICKLDTSPSPIS
jgi:hypothetical protein